MDFLLTYIMWISLMVYNETDLIMELSASSVRVDVFEQMNVTQYVVYI